MCFSSPKPTPAQTPAAAPAPPDAVAQQDDIKATRRAEDLANYGSTTPSLRTDRSVTSGGAGAGGSGLRM